MSSFETTALVPDGTALGAAGEAGVKPSASRLWSALTAGIRQTH